MAFFGKKAKQEPVHILTNKDSRPLAKGVLRSAPGARWTEFKIKGSAEALMNEPLIQAMSPDSQGTSLLGKPVHRKGNVVSLEPMRELGSKVRDNFRMPVEFESFLYLRPAGGRYFIRSADLSCGGIAFYCEADLPVGGIYDVVIPVTLEAPVIVVCQILRIERDGRYGCKFVGLIHDQEAMIREAVFHIQMRDMRDARQASRTGK